MSAQIYVDALRNLVRWHFEEEGGLPHSRSVSEHERDHGIELAAMVHLLRMGIDAWPFLLDAIGIAADDDELLLHLGAGDLESLVTRHGDELIDDIEARATENRALRVALSNVWGSGPVEERIARLLEVSGPPSRYWLWEWQHVVDRMNAYERGDIDIHALSAALHQLADSPLGAESVFATCVTAVDRCRDRRSGPDRDDHRSAIHTLRSFMTDTMVAHRAGEAEIRSKPRLRRPRT